MDHEENLGSEVIVNEFRKYGKIPPFPSKEVIDTKNILFSLLLYFDCLGPNWIQIDRKL